MEVYKKLIRQSYKDNKKYREVLKYISNRIKKP